MLCPACGSSSEATRICPGCGTELPEERPAPLGVTPAQAVATEAAHSPEVTEPAPELDATAARCPVHPTLASAGTCARCGRFVCLTCLPEAMSRRTLTCPECVARQVRDEGPKRLTRFRRELVGSFSLLAGLLVVVPVILLTSGVGLRLSVGLLIIAVPIALGLAVSAFLFATTKRPLFAWVGTALEALVLVPLFITEPSWCNAVLVAAPVYSVVRVLQVRELQRALAAPSAR